MASVPLRPALGLLLAGTWACDALGPELPEPAFGRIAGIIAEERWTSVLRSDSLVASYEPGTGFVRIVGTRPDRRGREATLALTIRTANPVGAFPFANIWRGPYGREERYALGAVADYWHPVGEGAEYYFLNTFNSIGEPGDSLVIEELDLVARTIRGRFRFHARSAGGKYEFIGRGSFQGRVDVQ
jgi:hypothetical protein